MSNNAILFYGFNFSSSYCKSPSEYDGAEKRIEIVPPGAAPGTPLYKNGMITVSTRNQVDVPIIPYVISSHLVK
jgi:hypothetical protein